MNKKLLFFFFSLFFAQIIYPMIQSDDKRKNISLDKQFNRKMLRNDEYEKKLLSINLYELAQTNMTILGARPFVQARKKAHKLMYPHNYLSDDQELFLNVLALPFELSLPIFFGQKYKNNQATIEVFCSQPVGKALELYSMLAEKYAKDEKLARLISFNELYANHTSYIELYDAIKYFSHNPEGVYEINTQQMKDFYLLFNALKQSNYFNNKNFLVIVTYYEVLCKEIKKFDWHYYKFIAGTLCATVYASFDGNAPMPMTFQRLKYLIEKVLFMTRIIYCGSVLFLSSDKVPFLLKNIQNK